MDGLPVFSLLEYALARLPPARLRRRVQRHHQLHHRRHGHGPELRGRARPGAGRGLRGGRSGATTWTAGTPPARPRRWPTSRWAPASRRRTSSGESLRDVPLERIVRGAGRAAGACGWCRASGGSRAGGRDGIAGRPRPRPSARRGARHRASRSRPSAASRSARCSTRTSWPTCWSASGTRSCRRRPTACTPTCCTCAGRADRPADGVATGAGERLRRRRSHRPAPRRGPAGRRAGPRGCARCSSRSSSSPPAPPSAPPATASSAPTAVQPPAIEQTGDGWRITGQRGREFSGLALNGPRLHLAGRRLHRVRRTWARATMRLLGPGPGHAHHLGPGGRRALRRLVRGRAARRASPRRRSPTTRRPAAAGPSGRRRLRRTRIPAISGDLAVWCSAQGDRRDRRSTACASAAASRFQVAAAVRRAGRLRRASSSGRDELDGTVHGRGHRQRHAAGPWRPASRRPAHRASPWPAGPSSGARRSDDGRAPASWPRSTWTAGHDDARRGPHRPRRPAYDGRTVVWGGERPRPAARVMGRRLGSGARLRRRRRWPATVIEVAVSGDTVAWIESAAGGGPAS